MRLAATGATSTVLFLSPLRDLFAAAFFIFFTFRIDPGTITDSLLPALLLALVTGATKVATGWWTARRNGAGPAGRRRAGTALVARGEFSIVIAGLAVGTTVTPELAGLATAYVLVLAIAGPVLARLAP